MGGVSVPTPALYPAFFFVLEKGSKSAGNAVIPTFPMHWPHGLQDLRHKRLTFVSRGCSGDTHHPIPEPRTQRLTRRNRGRFGWGCYLYPRTVLCGSETLHGRVSERQTLPLLGLGRGESRRAQRAFGTAMRMMRVAVPRRRGPVGTCSPAAGSCAVLVSFTVCHRCVEIQERAFTRLAVPTALSALYDVQWFCPMQ